MGNWNKSHLSGNYWSLARVQVKSSTEILGESTCHNYFHHNDCGINCTWNVGTDKSLG